MTDSHLDVETVPSAETTVASSAASEAGPSRLTPQSDKQDNGTDTVENAPVIGFSSKYQGSMLSARLAEDETVGDLKAILFSMTDVPPESQKLLGMVKGKQPSDVTLLGTIPYAPAALRARPTAAKAETTTKDTAAEADQACKLTVQFTLLGTPEAGRFKDQAAPTSLSSDQVDANEDLDYLDLQFPGPHSFRHL